MSGKGRREGWPENVIHILWYVSGRTRTGPLPVEVARYRREKGLVPEGRLYDAARVFMLRRERLRAEAELTERKQMVF